MTHEENRKLLERWLQGCFPNWPRQSVEDAVSEAFLQVLPGTGWAPPRDLKLLKTVAWRAIRGEWRKARANLPMDRPPSIDPLPKLEARSALDRCAALLDSAVEAHGGRKKPQMQAALRSRFSEGMSDTDVARQYGVRREAVNRARRFVVDSVRQHTRM